MPDVILKVVLPLAGLLMVLFCVGAYFFRYGERLKESVQEFKMFGADLKISIITVFVLVGLVLIFAGTYFTIVDTNAALAKLLEGEKEKTAGYQNQLQQMEGQITTLKLMQKQNKTLNYFLDLEGSAEIPNPKNLKVTYKLWNDEDRENVLGCTTVTKSDRQRLSITLSDLNPDSYVTALVVEDVAGKHKWKVNNFFPFSPALKLTQVKN